MAPTTSPSSAGSGTCKEASIPGSGSRDNAMKKTNNANPEDMELAHYGSLARNGGVEGERAESPYSAARHNVLRSAKKRLVFALSVCALVMIGEIAGSILSGSLAVLADASHLLTDVITYIISLTSIWLSQRPVSKRFTFGLVRAEVLGALFSIVLSFSLAAVLSYFAIMRIIHQDFEIEGTVMLAVSAINFAANIIQVCQLQYGFCCLETWVVGKDEDERPLQGGHGQGQGHGHGQALGHGHSHSLCCGSDDVTDHMNMRAACLHLLGDSLFGFGLLVGSLIIYFKPELKVIDPVLSIIFGVIVLITLLGLFRDTINILMAGKPKNVDFDDVRRRLVEIDGVEGVHSLRIWSLTANVNQVTVHLVLARLYDGQPVDAPKILREARHILETHHSIVHSTIQIETVDDGVDFLCARTPIPA